MAVVINVVGKVDTSDLARAESALQRLGGQADAAGTKGAAGMGKLSKAGIAVGTAIGTAVGNIAVDALYKLGGAITDAFGNAAEYQKLQDKLAQTIETTGNKAKISVEGVKEMAGGLESLSGVDENLIISNANVLASFGKIKNEGGKVGGTFDRTMAAALDLSVALDKDLNGTTLALGKALNNPIKGMTALSRIGVTFTKQEQEKIKTLQESGKLQEAQAFILGKLEGRFKGAAEAAGKGFTGSMARAQDAVGDLLRDAVTPLLDPLASMAESLASDVIPAIKDFGTAAGSILGDVFSGDLDAAAKKVGTWTEGLVQVIGDALPGIISKLGEIVSGIGNWIVTQGPVLALKFADWAFAAYNWILTEAYPKVLEFLGGLISGIATWISETAPTLGVKMGEFAGKMSEWVAEAIPKLLENLGTFLFKTLIPWIIAHIPDLIKALVGMVKGLAGFVITATPMILQNLGKMLLAIGKWIITDGIPGLIKACIDLGAAIVQGVWQGIQDAASWFYRQVTGFFSDIVDNVKSALGISSPSKVFAEIGGHMVTGLSNGITGNKKKVTKAMGVIQHAIKIARQYAITGVGNGVPEINVNPNLLAPGSGIRKLLKKARGLGVIVNKTADVKTATITRASSGGRFVGGGGSGSSGGSYSGGSSGGSYSGGGTTYNMTVGKGAIVLNIYQGVDKDIAQSIATAINEQLWQLAREIRAN